MWALLYSWLSIAIFGKTLGKTFMGVRVVDSDGRWPPRPPVVGSGGYLPAFLRRLGSWPAGILFGRERRAWHDHFAGTAVVYDWEAALHASRHRWLRGWNAKARRADLTKADRRSDGRVYPRQVRMQTGAEHLTGNESAIGGSRLDAGATLADQPEKPGAVGSSPMTISRSGANVRNPVHCEFTST